MNRFFTKITVLFLVITICVSFVAVSADTQPTQGVDDNLNEAMEVLRMFSIIPDYYDYSVNTEEIVPRADFVSGVAKMIGLTKYDGDAYYYDVPENHWAFNEVSALTQAGILNGTGNKLFKPDDKMTKSEGYKIIATILGYGDWAQYSGGYPTGYIAAANRADISDGVSSSEYITVSDMIRIFYNAITTSMLEPVAYGTKDVTYSANGHNTILSVYRDVYYAEGRVTGANCSSFDGMALDEGKIIIDNIIYDSEVDAGDYLGEKVKFFYKKEGKADGRTVLWVKRLNDKNVINVTVDNDAVFNKETYELEYLENGRERNIALDRGMVLVYNGGVVDSAVSEIFSMPRYTAKFVKDDNDKYSVAVVKAYENYVVGSIDSTEYVIYDKANGNRILSLDANDYDRLKIAVLGKTSVEFKDIKENNVLSVYLSKDKRYMDVHVSVDVATGVIDSVKNKKYGKTIQIDAIEYYAPETAKGQDVKVGQSVKLYLDAKGEVAFSEIDVSSYTPAYIIAAAESNDKFDNVIKLRVLTKQNGVKEMECDKSIKIDGKLYKDLDKVKNYLMPAGEFTPQFVMMRVSGQGKIKMLDTVIDNPDAEDDDVLAVSVPNQGEVTYRNRLLGHKAVLNTTSVIFSLPLDIENAEDKEFAVLSALTDWKTYTNVETYKVQDRVGYEQFVVVHGHNSAMYWESDIPVLVSSFCEVIGDDGDVYEGIIGYQGGAEKEFAVKEDVSLQERGVSEGDVIRLKMNPDGTIDDFEMIFDYDKQEESVKIGGYASQVSFSVGYVTDLVDGVIKIGKTKGSTDISIYTTGVSCVIYDENATYDKASSGSIASAKTYYTDGEECSMVVLAQSYGTPKLFVVYK